MTTISARSQSLREQYTTIRTSSPGVKAGTKSIPPVRRSSPFGSVVMKGSHASPVTVTLNAFPSPALVSLHVRPSLGLPLSSGGVGLLKPRFSTAQSGSGLSRRRRTSTIEVEIAVARVDAAVVAVQKSSQFISLIHAGMARTVPGGGYA